MEMVLPSNYIEVEQEEMMYLDGGGFVGVTIHFGPTIRGMSAVLTGAFAGAYVGFHLKALIATGPIGAGAAGVITAAVGGAVGWAINKGLREVKVGINIPFFSWHADVYVP